MAANVSGRTFETVISGLMVHKSIKFDTHMRLPVKSIFGKQVQVDVLIQPCDRFPDGLIIEAKWQDVPGSAEEKLPYLVTNIKNRYPCPTIIVIDGHGFTDGARDWLRDEVDNDKLLAVFSIKEFISWCNREL